jgi:hypothetical protein
MMRDIERKRDRDKGNNERKGDRDKQAKERPETGAINTERSFLEKKSERQSRQKEKSRKEENKEHGGK